MHRHRRLVRLAQATPSHCFSPLLTPPHAAPLSVGKIVGELEALGHLENTLLVYTSDHGEHFNYRAKLNKCTGHDDSIKIPMLLRWPAGGIRAGLVLPEPVGLQDIVPTLLAAVGDEGGASDGGALDGKSMLAAARGGAPVDRDAYYVQNVEDFRTLEEWMALVSRRDGAGKKLPYMPDFRNAKSEEMSWDRQARPPSGPRAHCPALCTRPLPSDKASRWAPQRALWTAEWKLVLSEHGRNLLYNLVDDPEEV